MNEKLLELYERCKRHNIGITIKTCLSDGWFEIRGETLAYWKNRGKYEHLYNQKVVTIDDLESYTIDIFEYTINQIFQELIEERRRLEDVQN